MEGNTSNSNIQDAILAGKQIAETKIHNAEKRYPFILIPDGFSVDYIETDFERPFRIKQDQSFYSIESFIIYIERFKNEQETILFLNEEEQAYRCYFDYHAKDLPGNCQNKAFLYLKHTEEFETWDKFDQERIGQKEFLQFLEDNTRWIVKPDAASIMELCGSLSLSKKIEYHSATRLRSGDSELTFSEKTEGGAMQKITVPEEIEIRMAPYISSEEYNIKCKLRFDLYDGKIKFHYKMLDISYIKKQCMEKFTKEIKDKTGLIALI